LNVSYDSVTLSPVRATRRNRTTSRTRWYGLSNGMPFHFSTMTLDEVPMPRASRPGAASASAAALWARVGAPRVKAGTIAVPRRRFGFQAAARVNGVNASEPPDSADHTSV
jgi:hypothetical protein